MSRWGVPPSSNDKLKEKYGLRKRLKEGWRERGIEVWREGEKVMKGFEGERQDVLKETSEGKGERKLSYLGVD